MKMKGINAVLLAISLMVSGCSLEGNRQVIAQGDWTTEGDTTVIATPHPDADGDGDPDVSDCNDTDATIFTSAIEIPYDGIDQDCDGFDLNDLDKDGYVGQQAGGPDCEDQIPDINPGSSETCNSIDDDCDGSIDEEAIDQEPYYTDGDGDGYGNAIVYGCEPPDGAVEENGDCNDSLPAYNPEALETCGTDNNCDGVVVACDETDDDHDGYREMDGDCDDAAANTYPGAKEICDQADNDCDKEIDENNADGTPVCE